MITINSADLQFWVASLLWPLTRILGLVATAPLFGNVAIPKRVKVALGIMLSLIIAPTVPSVPALDPMSMNGFLILAQQFVIGCAMGFTMRVVFAGMEMAGELTGMTMGLGFATFYDPQSRGRSSAISQFLALLTMMIYVSTNLHLVLLATLVDSFTTMPITAAPLSGHMFQQVASWGGRIFSSGMQLALPMIAALLVTNIALGILTRAAPQLNLFGIGFPITISVGLIMIGLALPYMTTPLERMLLEGFDVIRRMTTLPVP